MRTFADFLICRVPLREVTEMFPRTAMNALFVGEINKILPSVGSQILKDDLVSLLGMDFVSYIDSALRRAGFATLERDGLVSDIVVKLLVSPGGLIKGWKMDSPMSYRFKRSVKNAISSLATIASRRRRRFAALPDDAAAAPSGPHSTDDPITDFRNWLETRFGKPAVYVLNARLEDRDIKDLIGSPGIPSGYALKKLVSRVKSAALTWPGSDPAFHEKVRQLMDAEDKTIAKRFGRERAETGVN
jgi:hypothetical protein